MLYTDRFFIIIGLVLILVATGQFLYLSHKLLIITGVPYCCHEMEVEENPVYVFYAIEKRAGERLKIFTEGIRSCSSDSVSYL